MHFSLKSLPLVLISFVNVLSVSEQNLKKNKSIKRTLISKNIIENGTSTKKGV